MTLYYESELYHYGVPGMKWGHRKAARYYTKKANRARSMANYETAQRKKVMSSGNYNSANIQKSKAFSSKQYAKANKYQAKANTHKQSGINHVSKHANKKVSELTKNKPLEQWTTKDRLKNMTTNMSTKDMARAGYFGKAGRAVVKSKNSGTKKTTNTNDKPLEQWTTKDRLKNMTTNMSTKDMARAGYFGKAGRAVVKKKKRS